MVFGIYLIYIYTAPPRRPGCESPARRGGAFAFGSSNPWTPKVCGDLPKPDRAPVCTGISCLGLTAVAACALRSQRERSTGNTAGRSSQHKNEKAEVRGARSHSRHWKPGARRPLVPTAWLSPLHSRPVQTHQATTAAELRRGRRRRRAEMSNTISTSYINIALCSRVTPFGRRGLSAPSSRFFDGSATSFRRLCRPVL